MKYLFIDIKCANLYLRICEFGYVLTDDNFTIIEQKAIPIRPGRPTSKTAKFKKSIHKKNDHEFKRAYPINDYYRCFKFRYYYQFIKELVEDKDTLIFGYNAGDYIRYLDSEFNRFKVEPFNYKIYDVQKLMYYSFGPKGKPMLLKKAFEELCKPEESLNLKPYLTKDDAFKTMRILQEVLKNLRISVDQIIKLYPDSLLLPNEYLEDYLRQQAEKRLQRRKARLEIMWRNFYQPYIALLKKEESKGKRCIVSESFKINTLLLKEAIEYIKEHNLIPCNNLLDSDFIIVVDEEDKHAVLSALEHPYKNQFIILRETSK